MPNAGFLSDQETPRPTPEIVPAETGEASSVEADKQALEQLPEQADTFLEQAGASAPTTAVVPTDQAALATVTAAVVKDDIFLEVEKILEAGLGEYVKDLPPDARERFTKKGEEIAGQIATMVRTLQVKIKQVILLIRDWLLTIPGVNKFFLEQEAKIKTDCIVQYAAERREEAQKQP